MTQSWLNMIAEVESMIPLLGHLGRNKNIKVLIAGQELLANSVSQLISLLDGYSEQDITQIKHGLLELQNSPVKNKSVDVLDFLAEKTPSISAIKSVDNSQQMPVVLYGFGRIGRLLARRLCEVGRSSSGMVLSAIVVRKKGEGDLRKRASLLQLDSVHGRYDGVVKVDEENQSLIINGQTVKVIYASHPQDIDYKSYGIEGALLVDNTGVWRSAETLQAHLDSNGIQRVLLTAPGKEMKNIVFGVNDKDLEVKDTIISAASCTTNAIAPVLSVIEGAYGIESGHVETIHAYTNDQNLIDNIHKGDRRGRAAALNMVITETGAAKAVSKAIPSLTGKLSGSAIRVPVINASIAVLNLRLTRSTTIADLHSLLKTASSDFIGQIGFSEEPDAVSSDFIGSERAGTVDALSTKVHDTQVTLYVWYDNEYGYSCQVTRLMERLAQLGSVSSESSCTQAA
ncbi:glyceraldehyde-3-phosphate dehydrogenase [Marinomonas agarivorans]|nr:glyceraldehyde-3-phosphate dehydrogenase [Marinomonas agarivorans]